MRQQLLILLTTLIGQFSIGHSQAPYKINSCKIDFVFATGGFQKGTKTLVFTDSGKIEKQYSVTYIDSDVIAGLPYRSHDKRAVFHTLEIQTVDSFFLIDLDLMTGNKREKFAFPSSFMDDQMKKIREDTFLGKKCDVMDLGGAKLWYWKGIVLKKELPIDGVYEYAISIDENYIIKEDEFQIPKGIHF